MNVLQSFKTYSTVNPFSPLWELLYMATGVQRSPGAAPPRSFKGLYDLHLRRKTELAFDLTKGAFIIGVMTAVVYQWLPNDTLHAGQVLRQGDYIGACTLAPSLRKCTPTVAVVEPGRVAVYKGKHPMDEAKELLWASAKKEQPAKSADGWVAVVREDGTLALQDGADARKPAWASKLSGAARRARSFMVRAVVEDGELALYRSGVLAWSSKSA
ncbi:hypothetical protein JKP88DRAFT_19485 [Tribonema minus]|uniref:Bulb-type lectin domain-containing protein n=1 Tax=Tribonema minus TaxID=303371 RepID=A0A835Z9Q9_9STRA|nr:hypothetical protein JKP88DRAFT_19485 [Tribonema minus]